MVFQKRVDYGSCIYQVPSLPPHIPQAARGKRTVRKKSEDTQMCAFDMLATVAGKLLTEGENSSNLANVAGDPDLTTVKNYVKQEQFDEPKPSRHDVLDQDSCNESTLGSDVVFKRQLSHTQKESSQILLEGAPQFVKSDALDKESMISREKGKFNYERCSPQARSEMTCFEIDRNPPDLYSVVDPMDLDVKPPPLVSSDSSGGMPLHKELIPRSSSFPQDRSEMEIVDRDDDDNSSACTHPSFVAAKASRPAHIADRRVKKLLVSKFRKGAPTRMHKGEPSYTDDGIKPAFCSKKMCYTRQRTQRNAFKRRKLFERCSISTSHGGIFNQGLSNSTAKASIKAEASHSHATTSSGVNKAAASMNGAGDYPVRLSIKSFRIPELVIEIPESATVGSLKRTVMETVTAILIGSPRVGVIHHGKKVRDDNKTLQQAGISHGDTSDCLGFTLEPSCTGAPGQLLVPEPSNFLGECDITEPLARIPPLETPIKKRISDAHPKPALFSTPNCHESDRDSVHSPGDASSPDKAFSGSRAIVAVPPMNFEALAMVPLHKSKRSEHGQRRIRRPFSVAEVEALVQAVENLGTGRWRDVKLRAFDNAKHRTYVDLKDKWKTLVHTASISPQQRRGEPVPQELLDRVLSAQAFWSQQQAKLQAKPAGTAEACLLA